MLQRRVPAVAVAVALVDASAVVVALCVSCSSPLPDRCNSDDDCSDDARCLQGVCVAPGSADDLQIVDVDGDGDARPIAGPLPEGVAGVAGEHRVAASLRVRYVGAVQPQRAHFKVDDEIVDAPLQNGEEGVAIISVPSSLPAGRVLLLTLVAGAAHAEAPVFFLQGEPGPPGRSVLVADGGGCPLGGKHTLMGTDDDGDGVLDDDEVDVDRADCDTVVTADRTIAIADEAGLRAALRDLSTVRLAPSATVTLQLPPGTVAMSGEVVFDHSDGERIVLTGADAGTTVLSFPAEGTNGLVVTGGLRVRRLSIARAIAAAPENNPGTGILVRDAGFVVVEDVGGGIGSVVVSGFKAGVRAVDGGVLVAPLVHDGAGAVVRVLQAVADVTGYSAETGGTLDIAGALAERSVRIGFLADAGTVVATESESVSESAGSTGYLANFGGVLLANQSTSTVPGTGSAAFVALHDGSLSCSNATGSVLTPASPTAFAVFAADGANVVGVSATLRGKVAATSGASVLVDNAQGTELSLSATNNATVIHNCAAAAQGCSLAQCATTDATSICVAH